MTVSVPATITPGGNFPVANSPDIARPNGATVEGTLLSTAATISTWVQPTYVVEAGFYYNRVTGERTALNGYQALKYSLNGTEVKLRATASVAGTGTALAVYFDAANGVISWENQGPLEGATPFVGFELTIPPGTRAVAITGQYNGVIKLEAFAPRPVSNDLDAAIAAGAANAAAIVNTSKTANAAFDAIKAWSQPAYAVEQGVYYNRLTGEKITLNGYQAIKLALTGNELKLRATASVAGGATALAVYFDAAGAVIPPSQNQGPASGATQYTAFELTVPASARAVAITGQYNVPIKLEVLAARAVSADIDAAAALAAVSTAAAVAAAKTANAAYGTVTYWQTPTFAVEQGAYYKATTGAKVPNGTYQSTVIALTGAEAGIRASATTTGADTALAVYFDGSGAWLSSEFVASNSGNTAHVNKVLSPPPLARSVAITGIAVAALSFQVLVARDLAALDVKAAKGVAAAAALTAWTDSGAAIVTGYYISGAGMPVAVNGYSYLDYILDGSELAIRATGRQQGAATALATYVDKNGASLDPREFIGTGSNVDFVDQTLTPPPGTVKIRVCGVSAFTLSLRVQKVMSDAAQQIANLKAGLGTPARSIAVVGDSTAAQIAPLVAALYPARKSYAQGAGGQITSQIAARLGAKQVTLSVQGGALPTSGSVAVTPSIDLLFLYGRPSAVSIRILVMGVPCRLVCAASTGAYTLQLETYPGAALPLPANVPITVLSGMSQTADPTTAPSLDAILGSVVVLRTVRNDIGSGTTQAQLLADIGAINNQVAAKGGRLLVCTCINGNFDLPTGMATGATQPNATVSAARLTAITNINSTILSTLPDQAVDVLANHVMRGDSVVRSLNGTDFVVLNQPTLDDDGLHEKAGAARDRTANIVKANIDARGL